MLSLVDPVCSLFLFTVYWINRALLVLSWLIGRKISIKPTLYFKDFPKHIAIIPDGNRRFFREYNLPFDVGYKKSIEIFPSLFKYLFDILLLEEISLFVLSDKNLLRSSKELNPILNLLRNNIQSTVLGYSITVYGNIKLLPLDIQELISSIAEKSSQCTKKVNLFIAYSSKYAIQKGKEPILSVDLLVRTGHTHRLSDFMLGSLSRGSKIEMVDFYWPEMNELMMWAIVFKGYLEDKLIYIWR